MSAEDAACMAEEEARRRANAENYDWDHLVEKAKQDSGAPFAPEILDLLATLKQTNRAAFETVRARLKKEGVRVTVLDDAIAEETGEGSRGPTQADILIEIASA